MVVVRLVGLVGLVGLVRQIRQVGQVGLVRQVRLVRHPHSSPIHPPFSFLHFNLAFVICSLTPPFCKNCFCCLSIKCRSI